MPDISESSISMTVFEMANLENWQTRIAEAAHASGVACMRKGHACQLWLPDNLTPVRKTALQYVDGVRVVREWVGPKRSALAIIPRRMYFEDGADMPSSKPERALIEGTRPALPSPDKRISACLEWAGRLAGQIDGLNPEPMPVGRVRRDLHKSTRLLFGGGAVATPGAKTSLLLMHHGFYQVPNHIRIELAVPSAFTAKARVYQNLLANALKRCHCHGVISMLAYEKLRDRLKAANPQPVDGNCVLLAVTGKKGLPLTPDAEELIDLMTESNIPFRMFSVDNPSMNWSALDQVGSLVMGAGGVPFVTELPWPEGMERPFILGVDLGHPPTRPTSHVVISLMDQRGVLLESWRYSQSRDETIGDAALHLGLAWAFKAAQQYGGGENPPFLILRDGRLHQGEKVADYRKVLGKKITLVEFTKHDNPEMFIAGEKPIPAKAGTECLLAGSITPFITPVSARLSNDLPRTFKLNMPADWDGLGLGLDKVSEIVIGLSYTGGLGLAPHALPGPIYWADGIAAICDHNHQFSGQKISYG